MMYTVESKVEKRFHEQDIWINCTDRPWYNNAFGSNRTVHGIEVHKKDAHVVMDELARLGIEFIVRDAKYRNTKGCFTHKQFKFLEIPNHQEAYAIIGGDSL